MPHTFIAVTGMSPAVITESLYAIANENLTWPDQLQVITTAKGAELLIELNHDLERLCNALNRPYFTEDKVTISVIKDLEGSSLRDARSTEDLEKLGDTLMEIVRDLTSDPDNTVHASIAGGRKTMAFYLGYAMSLFGRDNDTLSHVLISEPFDAVPSFRFPLQPNRQLQSRTGDIVDARTADISLAIIPFVRLRSELPPALQEMGKTISFKHMVSLINLGETERTNRSIRLSLNDQDKAIVINDISGNEVIQIKFGLLAYGFYKTILLNQLTGSPSKRPDLGEHDTDLATEFAENLLAIFGLHSKAQPLTQMLEVLEDLPRQAVSPRTLSTLREQSITRQFFDQRCNEIKDELIRSLPPRLSQWLLIRQITDEQGHLIDFYGDTWPTNPKRGAYGIALSTDAIKLS